LEKNTPAKNDIGNGIVGLHLYGSRTARALLFLAMDLIGSVEIFLL
jgi:hypothetical protein